MSIEEMKGFDTITFLSDFVFIHFSREVKNLHKQLNILFLVGDDMRPELNDKNDKFYGRMLYVHNYAP